MKDLATTSLGAVGNESSRPPPQAAGYKALVKLESQFLEVEDDGCKHRYPVEAGMQTVAETHQGTRTVMEYLLSPVRRTLQEAGRER